MASANLLFFVLMLSSVRVGRSSESLFKLKCQPAVGVIGQTTHISCSIELYTKPTPVVINTVTLLRSGEKKPCFAFQPFENIQIGDSRFEVENGPSLQLHNTAFSDEGEYWYLIRTNLGQDQVQFTINVTAKYSNPIITSVQKEIVNDGAADLYCSANGGYPAGTIHWFDQSNTNWTKSATLQSTQGNDGLFTLSSKLSFQKIDSLWAPFRCVVLNNRYEEEGGTTSTLEIKDNPDNPPFSSSTVNNSIAGVVVIGSLIVGLLIVLLFKRRRNQQLRRASAIPILSAVPMEQTYPEEEKGLNEPVYKKAAEAEEIFTV
ncbi:butyrophilin-like protein 2 isoform X4 [Pangasianodon hypophthalmus]|uniref:butyrophilin-like protein 2 isoform X4 n=1 Tax=Pangasianodon hypophthalmus TaxID=310915 RepID=UPI0023081BC0|nr:butyrophilin-like protein 2 isoform X4 [Pangasianodon hypophthalmus]